MFESRIFILHKESECDKKSLKIKCKIHRNRYKRFLSVIYYYIL
jgi:hypothetical protein